LKYRPVIFAAFVGLVGCSSPSTERIAVCPLAGDAAQARDAITSGASSPLVWNYLGSVPLTEGWKVSEAIGSSLQLETADGDLLWLSVSCCGASPAETDNTLTRSGRLFRIIRPDDDQWHSRIWTTPFADISQVDGPAIRSLPAILEARINCTSPTRCEQAEDMVFNIAFDEKATKKAIAGEPGPGLSGLPLRDDGIPDVSVDLEIDAQADDIYTLELCPPSAAQK
jgi:hypothetical protein